MPSTWPVKNDVFIEPSAPESTPLSSAGSGDRNHAEHHRDLGDAIEQLEKFAGTAEHDHSGGTGNNGKNGPKLKQVNTHAEVDTDKSDTAIHHTLGRGDGQAAPGKHKHDQDDITGLSVSVCTSGSRPANPTLGAQIVETDTNRLRAWLKLPAEATPRWVLMPGGSVPICRLLAGVEQRIINTGSIVEWRIEEEDNFGMFDVAQSLTEIVIREPGLYSIDASVAWSPDRLFGDRAQTRIMLNGAATTRQHFEFVRGNAFTPGFAQSVDLSAKVRFKTGDRLSIQASHNGFLASWLFSSTSSKIDTRLDVSYIGF